MQTIILCGGKGTRMKEETDFRPKAMVEIGGMPILWHIMRTYMHYGYNDFIIALGYKGEMIKEFFHNYKALLHDFSVDTKTGDIQILGEDKLHFKVTLIDTEINDGRDETMTGARILKVAPYLKGDEFMVTFGDGVSDLNIKELVDFHHKHGKLGTLTGVHPQSRFGLVDMDPKTNEILSFREKPVLRDYISGGFMVFNKETLKYVTEGMLDEGLTTMAEQRQLCLYPYEGFWKAVDTFKELEQLNKLWMNGRPWAVWEKNK
ncbi:MAG TPA: sugar phosphate nucleotidyltransferase [Patescibacteria group bacterium]|nr:sugar phosphate nucleotidyltransferase [Patescibacteria group bacterium]